MLTLEKFEQLAKNELPLKLNTPMSAIGRTGERIDDWVFYVSRLDKCQRYREIKSVVLELAVADIDDSVRTDIAYCILQTAEKLIAQTQQECITNPQSLLDERTAYVEEARSLYFLFILCYQGVAFRTYALLTSKQPDSSKPKQLAGLFQKLSTNLPSTAHKKSPIYQATGQPKKLYSLAVRQIMALSTKALMEYALLYQRPPNSLWGLMNSWYLKSALIDADQLQITYKEQTLSSICQEYIQACLASFANLFAYRRPDIFNVFRVLPKWADYVTATLVPDKHLKMFVNLQGKNPPELITPYASVNPYSKDRMCLFFDGAQLFHYLQGVSGSNDLTSFEVRLAKMVLVALSHQNEPMLGDVRKQTSQMVIGFESVFQEIAGGKSFAQVIAQSRLSEIYRPKREFVIKRGVLQKQNVTLIRKSDIGVHFIVKTQNDDEILCCPYLPVFGIFAIKSPKSQNKHPWRLGIVHWVEGKEEHIEVSGKFLGRLLSVCGIRLSTKDRRSQDFVQAFLVSGDGLNQQTTLILLRYHFKENDTVVLRVGEKQTTLILKKNLLSTDDIEQYEVVRLAFNR